jgi:hypothetical protein
MPRCALVALCIGATALTVAAPAQAEPPVPRQVTYTVTTETAVLADIYFRDVDPPSWADYSHNPYLFSPKASAEITPDRPWVLHVTLMDPDRWAMVSATSGRTPGEPKFRCELAVDGVVVATSDGPKGALCAIRHW